MSKSVFLPKTLIIGLLTLCGVVSLQAQYVRDREPIGPSSRKTGLVISEIMYNPRLISGLPTNQTHEFVEFYNSKPWPEDISGYFVDGAVRFTFPPGTVLPSHGYLVLARVPGLIQTNYGITNVVGPWIGANTNRLGLDGGTVRLRNPLGAVLLQVDYRDSPPWPETGDGTGHSIVLVRPSWGENNDRAWGQSDKVGGSPGGPETIEPEPISSVFINEFSNHSDPVDWIELYNHSNDPVDLSGAWLSDDPLTNKFRIPNGIFIAPRGFLTWDQNQLGFELFAGGETIFLWNSNQTRVIDVVDFRGSSNNVTQGRSPDGGPFFYGMHANTRGGPNSAPARYPVVINEVMFNPISGNTDDEYVEIVNRTGTSQNIAGYEFVVGIAYSFPTNSLTMNMPPGAHWVVARNPANLASIYSNLSTNSNLFGPFTGTLANGGERVALACADYDNVNGITEKLNVVVSDFVYGDGGKWGNWGDGAGSSLELIDPEADPHFPSNWADSNDTGESLWTAIEYNGPLGETLGSPVNDSLIIMHQGVGECLVDEVEVRIDGGPNLVSNGGFEGGLNGWTLQGSHDFSTIENSGFAGTKSMRLRAASRGDNQSNRILSAPFANGISPGPHQVSIRAKVRWLRGFPEILFRLHGSATEAYGRMNLPRRLGSPGTTNSTRVINAGPAVSDVTHSPLLPTSNDAVVVTARANDRQGIAAITLRYRIDPNPTYLDVAMVDDGTGADAIANDGIYSGAIPPQAEGTVVPFYVEARDGLNAIGTFPQYVFPLPGFDRCWPNDSPVRECIVRWGEVQMPGDFATYHLWLSSVNSNRWHTRNPLDNAPMDGTFIYNNARVVYNAVPLFSGSPFHRTNSTAGPAGPLRVDYVMNFPDDEPMLGATDFVLNNPGNPDQYTISDQSAVAEATVYKIFEGIGLPNNHRRYIHFFVNGSQRSKAYERAGNFIFEDSQQPNGDIIDEWFSNDPGGQLFKVEDWFEFETNGFDVNAYDDADLARKTVNIGGQQTFLPAPYRFKFRKRSVNVGNSANDFSTIYALINAASPADNPTNSVIDPTLFGTVADFEMWMRHFAVQRAVGNFDSYGWMRGKNDYLYGTASGFVHLPWDIDYSLGLGRGPEEPLFETADPRIAAMFNTPEIVRAYWRAFDDLVNGPFNNAVLDPFIDARVNALLTNNIDIDLNAVQTIKDYIRDRRIYLQGQLTTVFAPFAIEGETNFETPDNYLVITGTAPVSVKQILLNGVVYPTTWLSATSFAVRVVLAENENLFTITGRDRFGNFVPGALVNMSINYTGPVPNPIGAVVFSEIMFAPAATGGQFIELVNRTPTAFNIAGWRIDPLNFTFPFGTIMTNGERIVVAQNRDIFRTLYGNKPIAGIFTTAISTQGQWLTLVKPGTNIVFDTNLAMLNFETEAPWPPVTNGISLQLLNEASDVQRAANWGADYGVRGTPGASNSIPAGAPFDSLWLNEVQIESLTGPLDNFGEIEPWIELFNSGTNALNLDAYYLSDTLTNVLQWQFPTGTVIQAGERMIIWADGEPLETDGTNLHTSFRLTTSGKLALARVVEGQPQIVDHFSWRSLGPNAAFGSWPEGEVNFHTLLHTPTPGNPNTRKRVALFINEFLARNTVGIADEADGARNDWIEIYNGGLFPVDLGGFYLTDNNNNLTKYRVPTNGQYRVPAGGYLHIWADDQQNQNSPARADLHVNFALGGNSGDIGLIAPDGITAVDALTYGLQTNDISYGRLGDGAAMMDYMTILTPRGRNSLLPLFNTTPAFPPPTNQVVAPGQILIYTPRPGDPDRPPQVHTYTLLTGPTNALLLPGGTFRWPVPTNQALGNYFMSGRVVDNGVPPKEDIFSFWVTVRSTNSVTAPNVIRPVIRNHLIYDGQLSLSIETIPGRTYRVWYKDDLSAPNWTLLDRDFVAAGTLISITDLSMATQRFYRVEQAE